MAHSQTGKTPIQAKDRVPTTLTSIIAQLLINDPNGTDEDLFEAFKELIGFNTAVVRKAALLEPMIERDFLVHLHRARPVAKALDGITKLEPKKRGPKPGSPRVRSIDSEDERKAVYERLANATANLVRDASIRLLEVMTPMGKPLSATTFAECAKLGGWYADLATKGAPDQPIGDVLNERQVRTFFDAFNSK